MIHEQKTISFKTLQVSKKKRVLSITLLILNNINII